jgi:hypothetical protein
LIGIAAIATLVVGWQVAAFATLPGSDFEGNDGNLRIDGAAPSFDWNGFESATWSGTSPNRVSSATIAGWDFDGLEDRQASTSDNGFAGGTKQDAQCASVISAKAPNKDDLKRVYFANKRAANGDILLELAWARIAQNTTSPSAHVAFEFNQSKISCGANSGGLVQRTAGDMLIVYDFEGSATDNPTLTLSRWVTTGACEVSSNTAPCWGPADALTPTESEAKVNTSLVGPVLDEVADPNETLQLNEFGEAGINLTKAGVFTSGQCTSFGKAYAVSRTSGSSSTAQMKDLVGPGNVDINNCGGITVHKKTVPSPDPTTNTFDYTSPGLTPASFTMVDGGTQSFGNQVQAGTYTITETDANQNNFTLSAINCTVTGSGGSTTSNSLGTGAVTINLKPQDSVDCTFVNTLQAQASSMTSEQSFIPNDSATISAPQGGNLAGTVTFKAYESSDCSGTAILTQNVAVSGASPQTVGTDNTTVKTTAANISWNVSYDSTNPAQQDIPESPATCFEKTALNIDNGGTVSSP